MHLNVGVRIISSQFKRERAREKGIQLHQQQQQKKKKKKKEMHSNVQLTVFERWRTVHNDQKSTLYPYVLSSFVQQFPFVGLVKLF